MSVPVWWLRGLGAVAVLGGVCVLTLVEAAPVSPDGKSEPPAERIRKALDKPVTLKFAGESLEQAVAGVRELAKINVVLDRLAIGRSGWSVEQPGLVTVEMEHVKLRAGLRAMLAPLNLTAVIVNGTLLITAEHDAVQRQMQQRVSVNFDTVPLKAALQHLAQETAVNLLLDPRTAKEGQNPVSLRLDDVPLDLTVRLVAEAAGLSVVRLDNVLVVADESQAQRLRSVAAEHAAEWPGTVQFNAVGAQPVFGGAGRNRAMPVGGGLGAWPGGVRGAQPLPPQPAVAKDKAFRPAPPAKDKQ